MLGGCGLAGYLVLLWLQGLWMLSTVVFLYVYLKVDQAILVFVFFLVFAQVHVLLAQVLFIVVLVVLLKVVLLLLKIHLLRHVAIGVAQRMLLGHRAWSLLHATVLLLLL